MFHGGSQWNNVLSSIGRPALWMKDDSASVRSYVKVERKKKWEWREVKEERTSEGETCARGRDWRTIGEGTSCFCVTTTVLVSFLFRNLYSSFFFYDSFNLLISSECFSLLSTSMARKNAYDNVRTKTRLCMTDIRTRRTVNYNA